MCGVQEVERWGVGYGCRAAGDLQRLWRTLDTGATLVKAAHAAAANNTYAKEGCTPFFRPLPGIQ